MKLYIANCTTQVLDFIYRMPETGAQRSQRIDIFSQQILSGDLRPVDIDSIVEQHARYGLVKVDEIDRTKPFIGMCYSIDKPINVAKIRTAIDHNKSVLELRGQELRKEAAVATHQSLQEKFTDPTTNRAMANLDALEMSVEEEKPGTGGVENHKPISEGTRVSTNEEPSDTPRPSRRGRRAA